MVRTRLWVRRTARALLAALLYAATPSVTARSTGDDAICAAIVRSGECIAREQPLTE